ncbi:purine-nucleoside phosphorylase [bacterium]|nr:purine-nucleoside phosphorylase [bacterium]
MIEHLTALKFLRRVVKSFEPKVALVLGSGLGDLADSFDQRRAVPYRDIPDFPHARVAGHAGNLVFGNLSGLPLVAMQGRVHYYEGHPMSKVVFGIQLMKLLGANVLITSNAVGGINKSYKPGDLVLIRDHLNFLGDHPLRGQNPDRLGPRFYDMSRAYDPDLLALAHSAGKKLKIHLHEGVYAACPGPSYETPAEIRMLRTLGADTVGMSTVPEIQAGRHMGMRCLGISCVSNLAAGVSKEALSHKEVIETAARVGKVFQGLVKEILLEIFRKKSLWSDVPKPV